MWEIHDDTKWIILAITLMYLHWNYQNKIYKQQKDEFIISYYKSQLLLYNQVIEINKNLSNIKYEVKFVQDIINNNIAGRLNKIVNTIDETIVEKRSYYGKLSEQFHFEIDNICSELKNINEKIK